MRTKLVALTCSEPPGEGTPWIARAIAEAVARSLWSIHLTRTFKRANTTVFAEPVEDIVGLYMHAPAPSVVLSVGEMSQIELPDRTQTEAPVKHDSRVTVVPDDTSNHSAP